MEAVKPLFKVTVGLCSKHSTDAKACYVLHCTQCGEIGGHYSRHDFANDMAAAHSRSPHEIVTDQGRKVVGA